MFIKITNNGIKKVFYFYVKMLCWDKIMTDRCKTAACHDEKDHIEIFRGFESIQLYGTWDQCIRRTSRRLS